MIVDLGPGNGVDKQPKPAKTLPGNALGALGALGLGAPCHCTLRHRGLGVNRVGHRSANLARLVATSCCQTWLASVVSTSHSKREVMSSVTSAMST